MKDLIDLTEIHPAMPADKDTLSTERALYYKVKDKWFVNCFLVSNPYENTESVTSEKLRSTI